MARIKVKPKRKTKLKAKVKAKPITRRKAKSKLKIKSKPKTKLKTKSKPKPVRKTKISITKKKSATSKRKPNKKSKAKSATQFSKKQKSELLETIAKIIVLHKSDQDGLKSLTEVERILDKYNQHYTDANAKFDAIVHYGASEDPIAMSKNFFTNVESKDKETADFYLLLLDISKGKTKFTDVKNRIGNLYAQALQSRK